MASDLLAQLDFSGRNVLVTGGGKGIGAAIALRFVELGARVTIADREASAEQAASDLGASFQLCDIADAAQLEAAVVAATHGAQLDVLVNNAGIFPTTGPMLSASDEFVHQMLEVNVRAQFSTSREAAARMTNGGAIVNMASIAALGGGANISAYREGTHLIR